LVPEKFVPVERLGSQFRVRAADETCWTLPSPSMMFPKPAALPCECIFKDQAMGLLVNKITSLPCPLAGEKP
jgi:hypothetical protein